MSTYRLPRQHLAEFCQCVFGQIGQYISDRFADVLGRRNTIPLGEPVVDAYKAEIPIKHGKADRSGFIDGFERVAIRVELDGIRGNPSFFLFRTEGMHRTRP